VVFDCTELESFDGIMSWLSQIELNAPKDIRKYLVANKIDIDQTHVDFKGDVKASQVSNRASAQPDLIQKKRVVSTEAG